MIPVFAAAAEVADPALVKHTHSDAHACSAQCGGNESWIAWGEANKLPTDSGHYYLTGDVQLTASNDVPAGKDITICLNGYNIHSKLNTKVAFVYGKLTISDCTAYELDGTYISGTVVGSTAGDGAVYGVRRGGTFVLESGRITGGKTTGTGGGGVIYTQGGTSAGAGGMVYMYGGEMVGVEGYNGGAVCLGGGSADYTPSAFYMYGGKITGNYARNHGGGIYVVDWSILEIHGGEVTGNTVKNNATSVYMAGANSKLTVSGAAKLDGVFFNNASNKGLMVDELTEGAAIDVTTTATDFAKVISIAQGGKQDVWSAHWVTANGDSVSMVEGAFKAGHYHGDVKYEAWTGSDSHNTLPTGAKHYYLANDILRNTNGGTVSIAAGTTQHLCLNGHTITHRNPANRLYAIQGTFVLEDCTAKTEGGQYLSGGITYGGATPSTRTYGNCFSVQRGGTMIMEEGQIYGFTSDCKDYEDSVPVYIQGATAGSKAQFIMNGGQIHSNSSKSLGAAIKSTRNGTPDLNNPSLVEINGGKIWGNTSTTGGAVAATGDVVRITGGQIVDNTCALGAVYLSDQAQGVLAGNPQIRDNRGGNLYLAGLLTLQVEELEKTARIYLDVAQSDRAITGQVEASVLENFYCDNTYRMLLIKEDKLFIEVSDEHPHCLCYGRTEGCDHKSVKWQAWVSETSLPTSTGYYYLLGDVRLTEGTVIPENQDVKLCLNGKTISGTRLLLIRKNSTLSTTDCGTTGTITGGNRNYGGAVNVNRMGTFNLYGGTITGNSAGVNTSAASLGGGVYIQAGKTGEPGGIFNMYGGTLSKNDAYQGGAIHLALGENPDAVPAQVNLYGGTIIGNTAGGEVTNADGSVSVKGGSGAAIYIGKYGKLNMAGGLVTENAGLGYGGTIYLSGATGTFSGGTITKNTATRDGAGFYAVSESQVEITGSVVIRDNTSAKGAGGGFGAASKSRIKMTGGTVSGNWAVQGGGAIIQSGAALELQDGLFSGNYSKNYAGAIYINTPNADGTPSSLKLTGGTITKNTSDNAGGGIYGKQAKVDITGGTISYNENKNFGCGVYLHTSTGSITGGTITGNVSGKDGAGLYGYGGTVEIGGDVKITNNTSLKGAGGGMGFTKECKAKLTGGTITGNKAVHAGGIIVQGKAHLTMTGGYVAYNTTTGNGGGVYVNKSSMDFYGGTIANNKSVKTGGGLFANESVTRFAGTTFASNQADGNGGATYINKGAASYTAGTFKNNSSQRYGGGMSFNAAQIEAKNIKVIGNFAKLGSGGTHGYDGKITMENVLYSENSTDVAGGGLCVTRFCEATINSSVFEKNKANNGGGLLVQNWAKLTLNDCVIRENETSEGSGLYLYTNVEAWVNGGEICDNVAYTKLNKSGDTVGGRGAGVFLHTDRNTYSGASTLHMDGTRISGNKAELCGGGIYVDMQMILEASNITVDKNTAPKAAGVYTATGTTVTLTDATITANTAQTTGSGIYAQADLVLHNVSVTANTTQEGSAVYLAPARFDGHSFMAGIVKFSGHMKIAGNTGTMPDLFVDQGTTISVDAAGLGEDTEIYLQLHSGLVTYTIFGAYDYEGENGIYTITYGDRSVTEPEYDPSMAVSTEQTQKTDSGNALLYAGVGVIALAAIAGVVLLLLKKKKSPAGEGK